MALTTRANPGRVSAARALAAVEDGAFAEEILGTARLSSRDIGLSWFLTFGVLRCRGRVDAALRARLHTPLGGLDPFVRAVLRLGAFEKLHGRAQPHVVVHQAVQVARVIGAGRASGLINAVLRRVEEPAHLTQADALDHPAWLVARWTARYGVEATERWCTSNREPPPLTLAGPALWDGAAALQTDGRTVVRARCGGTEVPDAVTVTGHRGQIDSLPGFAEGRFWIQDAAAIHVADMYF